MRVNRWAAIATFAMISALALSGCATGTPTAGSTPPATPVPTIPSSAAVPPPVATTAAPVTPVTTSYDAARAEWIAGAAANSATQPGFWLAAVTDLTAGETTDTDPTGYAAAIVELKSLAALPDAQQSAAQNAEYHTDINGLNVFFKTPNEYS